MKIIVINGSPRTDGLTAKSRVIFRFGILPFVQRKGAQYQGVTDRWQAYGFTK